MRRFAVLSGLVAGLVVALCTPFPRAARALPLFVRGSGPACIECHVAVPRLNATGLAFRQNGYRRPGENVASHSEPGRPPLALVGEAGAEGARVDSVGTGGWLRTSRSLQGPLAAHSAGTLAAGVSYHVAVESADADAAPRATIAFVQLDDLAKGGGLNLRVGEFDAALPFFSNRLRTTTSRYLAPVDLDARGLELNGAHAGWTWAAGLIDSHRDPARRPPGARTFERLEDTYFSVTRALGQAGVVGGRMWFDRQDTSLPTLTWMQHLHATVAGAIDVGDWVVAPGYVLDRYDDRPAAGIHEHTQYATLEAVGPLDRARRWSLTARMEHAHRTRTVLTPEVDQQLEVASLMFVLRPEVRLSLEGSHQGDDVGGPRVDALDGVVRVAF